MQISVIIPVYNTEQFVAQAIQSAIHLTTVGEILVIDDGSTDNSMKIIDEIAQHNPKLKVLYHPKKENKGPAASRNLGIKAASYQYIAFLDADDIYLPHRFDNALSVLTDNPSIDGVHETVQLFENDVMDRSGELIGMTKVTDCNSLFYEFFPVKNGFFQFNGLTLRREVFQDIGFFDESLRQGEDTDLTFRLALQKCLIAGNLLEPVALVRQHKNRGIYRYEEVYESRHQLFSKWFSKALKNDWGRSVNWHILINMVHYDKRVVPYFDNPIQRWGVKIILLVEALIRYPAYFRKLSSF